MIKNSKASNPLAHNFRHIALEQAGSTNDECMDHAGSGDAGNLWITANTQYAGKGRRGREWLSQAGNLFASLLLVNPSPPEKIATLPFVASLAVTRAIIAGNGSSLSGLSIKWPNDVLIDGKKISGILLESTLLNSGSQAIVIGCGINCLHAPKQTLYPTTSLAEQGVEVSAEKMFTHLHEAMIQTLEQWNSGAGFAHIRNDWLEWATGLGKPVVARFEDHEERGIFVDVDSAGYMLLDTGNGVKKISAADIFFQNETKQDKTPK